jgi:hypothetical protein
MKIDNVEFEYFIDYINKKIHLLDSGNVNMKNLINTITPEFQKLFIEKESLLADLIEFEWICYSSDGIIASYNDYSVKLMNPKLPYLHKPFKVLAETRRKRHRA